MSVIYVFICLYLASEYLYICAKLTFVCLESVLTNCGNGSDLSMLFGVYAGIIMVLQLGAARAIRKACHQSEKPDELTRVAEESKGNLHIVQHLPSDIVALARRTSTDAAIYRRGGKTFPAEWNTSEQDTGEMSGQFFRATLTWQNVYGATDLDMHMVCPKCRQEVYFGNKQCKCRGKPWHLKLDLDDRGSKWDSEENMWVDKTSSNDFAYELQVKLYSGRPVPFTVLFKPEGHPDYMYNFQPHSRTDEKITIFTWRPSDAEPKVASDQMFFDLTPLPSGTSTRELPEMRTFSQ